MNGKNKSLGKTGEDAAANYLIEQGYHICKRNYRVPTGEIDIIAKKGDTIVFIEVKTRRSLSCGTPAQSVGYYKQQKIIQTARWFLRQGQIEGCPCRFDVIEVYVFSERTFKIRHLRGAFEV
ncbi:MAG TPA: YraN family protein [Selenomonas sp.]|nr:YraN family protein [Selenomonadaceae bacterium]HCB93458.1 YraN family protein [Selenomonas sp.]